MKVDLSIKRQPVMPLTGWWMPRSSSLQASVCMLTNIKAHYHNARSAARLRTGHAEGWNVKAGEPTRGEGLGHEKVGDRSPKCEVLHAATPSQPGHGPF